MDTKEKELYILAGDRRHLLSICESNGYCSIWILDPDLPQYILLGEDYDRRTAVDKAIAVLKKA